jgi:hypothetical protein
MNKLKNLLSKALYVMRYPLLRAGAMITLVILTCTLLVSLAWWGPMKLEQWKTVETIDENRYVLQEVKRVSEISQANRNAQITVALMEKKLHAEMNQAQAVQQLSKLAASQKVRVLSQSFETGKKQDQIETLYIDLTLLGDYRGIRGMLAELPKMKVWIEVLEANMSSAVKGGEQVKCQLTLAVYRYAQNNSGRGEL